MGSDRSLGSGFLAGAAAEYFRSLALHLLRLIASYSLQLQPLKKQKRPFPRGFTSSVVYGRVYGKIPQSVKLPLSSSPHKTAHNFASVFDFCRKVRTDVIMGDHTK